MSLAKGEVNPLNVLGVRRLSYSPVHFARMTLSTRNIDNVDHWIYQNLESRYSITKGLKIDSEGKMIEIHELGIEDGRELTIMSLMCPFLDKTT
jgi:hypothetical protein